MPRVVHTCESCKVIFTRKNDLTKHNKIQCNKLPDEQKITIYEVENNEKSKFKNMFIRFLDLLRNAEAITGEKALRNISYLLTLKLIEPHIGNEIKIDEYDFDFSFVDNPELYRTRLMNVVRFSNLSSIPEENLTINLKDLWEDVLSVHPATCQIFMRGKGFDIKGQKTFKIIIDDINKLNFSHTDHDLIGNAYEEIIQDMMTGKVFGQFFTPWAVKNLMVELIEPKLYDDGTFASCCDPSMGCGGFLISYLRNIIKQATERNIALNWNYIKTQGLFGKELEHDTYQLAMANMLISSGHVFEKFEMGDSIRKPITRKFDNIVANPPFGIHIDYDDFNSELKEKYTPIKVSDAVPLFIQAMIYMLNIEGKCAVVLPDGKDLFGKQKASVLVREYLMKSCDLKEVIILPSGIFTNTTIGTCILYFVKKVEDVIAVKYRMQRGTQTISGRTYVLAEKHQTIEVKFFNCDPRQQESKTLLTTASIEDIATNSYSLNYTDYMKKNEQPVQYTKEITEKTLNELCEFLPKSKRPASYGEKQGTYPFYTSSQNCVKFCNTADYEQECLIIGTGGNANIKIDKYFSCSADNFVMYAKESVNLRFIYYYLYLNMNILQDGFAGAAIKHISKEYIKQIKIPLPSLEQQHKAIEFLDFIYNEAIKTSEAKILQLKKLNAFCLEHQERSRGNEVKTLSEICEIDQGRQLNKSDMTEGMFNVIGGGKIIGTHNISNMLQNTITLTRVGDCNINFMTQPYYLTDNGFSLTSSTHIILIKYIYFMLVHNTHILTLYRGSAQKVISKTNLKQLQFLLPSLERQAEIVEYCDKNEALIKELEQEIERNKQQANQYMANITQVAE